MALLTFDRALLDCVEDIIIYNCIDVDNNNTKQVGMLKV